MPGCLPSIPIPSTHPEDTTAKHVSPIGKLPNELLASIFAFCAPRVDYDWWIIDHHPEHSLNPHGAPWSLTRVCRRWSALSIACSELWSTIIVRWNPSAFEVHLALVQLARSANRPLSIYIPFIIPNGKALLNALFLQSYRWRYALLPADMDGIDMVTSSQSLFPLLEYLDCPWEALAVNLPPLHSSHFPRLRFASFDRFEEDSSIPPLLSFDPLVLSQLTCLELKSFDFHDVLPLLHEAAHSLHTLNLQHFSGPIADIGTVTLFQLRRLLLDDVLDDIIYTLCCPALQQLFVASCGKFNFWTTLDSPPVFHQTLRYLNISWSLKSDTLITLLSLTINLEFLQLHQSRVMEEGNTERYMVERVFSHLSDINICPQLRGLSVHLFHHHMRGSSRIVEFAQLVRSRAETLRTAHLYIYDDDNVYFKNEIQGLIVYDALTQCRLKSIIERLRTRYPFLDLRIRHKFDLVIRQPNWRERVVGDLRIKWYQSLRRFRKKFRHRLYTANWTAPPALPDIEFW